MSTLSDGCTRAAIYKPVLPYALIDGTRAADVELCKVRVPASSLLVAPRHSLAILDEAIDRTVLAQVAEALGAMQAVRKLIEA